MNGPEIEILASRCEGIPGEEALGAPAPRAPGRTRPHSQLEQGTVRVETASDLAQ